MTYRCTTEGCSLGDCPNCVAVMAPDGSPAALVRVFRDGDAWSALVGPDLQEGVGGFGSTPADALTDLATNLIGHPWPEGVA